ncbi:MAG: HlyC/CorC family transporter [Oscillospiraceae bacterium]|nr:HlyC/CorC family transporter [Oscillospiraceae bacterium]
MPDDAGGNKKTLLKKIFGNKSKAEEEQKKEEEILSLVEEGHEKGLFKDETKNFIENLFDFDDTTASEIMTHRTEMTAVEDTDPLSQIVQTAIESGYSRIPVYHDDIDNITGILYVKDLLKYVCSDVPESFKITDITRDVMCVPRSKNLSQLFAEMTKKKIQLAIVVDEYGGTEGIITLEDLIEDIMGNIQDEYDNEDEEGKKLSENKFNVEGTMTLDDVSNLIGYEFPKTDCDTIAGFILEKTGQIPAEGDHPVVIENNLKLTVLEVEDRRIAKILIEKNVKK